MSPAHQASTHGESQLRRRPATRGRRSRSPAPAPGQGPVPSQNPRPESGDPGPSHSQQIFTLRYENIPVALQHAVLARLHHLLRSHPLWCLLLDAPRICSQQQPAHDSSQQASGGTKTWRSCPLRGSQPRTPGTALSTALLNHNQFRYLALLQP